MRQATKEEIKQFIATIGPMAQKDMKKNKILASLTIAQACQESTYGISKLAVEAHNIFGVKGSYNGQSVQMYSPEEDENGNKHDELSPFKKYPSWQESLDDHSRTFNTSQRYANLRGETDYEKACLYVRQDGYCTDSNYTGELLELIREYELYKYDVPISDNDVQSVDIKISDTVKSVDSILVDGNHYVKMRDLDNDVLQIDYTDKPKISLKVTRIDVRENGVVKQVEAINIAGHYYVKLQDLKDSIVSIGYDTMPFIKVTMPDNLVPSAKKLQGK